MNRLVLLMEGDALIGIDLVDALQRAGYRVLGPCATAAEAFARLERDAPGLAILDPLVLGDSSAALAAELSRRGVPFLVHTTLTPDAPGADAVRGRPWLRKPTSASDVVETLDGLSRPAGAWPAPAPIGPASRPRGGEPSRNPFLRKLESFAALSDPERALVERISADPRVVPSHSDLIREGDRPEGVFLVMSGFACRHKLQASGQRQIMAYLLPGDMCDLDVALLATMDHTLTTLSPCTVVRIRPETIAELMGHPRLARALRMSTLVDEATLREWLVNVGSRSALARIAHLFCELQERLRAVGLAPGNGYEFPITQGELGDTTGLSSVHVNRTLQELRRRGLIELREKRLQILNLPGLRAVAGFKANYLHLGDRVAA